MSVDDYAAVTVYTRENWADAWTERAGLAPLRCVDALSPEKSYAEFEWRYGADMLPGETSYASVSPLDIANHYVKVSATDVGTWYGIIIKPEDHPHGVDGEDPSGVQMIRAVGMSHLLETARIEYSHALDVDANAITINRVLPFNRRNSAGGTLIGNRCTAQVGGKWYFSDDGATWTGQSILQYALDWFAPTITGAAWSLGSLDADLDQISYVLFPRLLSLRHILDQVADRRRGYAWHLRIVENDGLDDDFVIDIVSVLASDVSVGGDTFRQNPFAVDLDISSTADVEDALVVEDHSQVYDTVRVEGARVRTCFTVAFADSTLEAGWSAAEQTEYLNAANDAADYATLTRAEQIRRNEQRRADDATRRAFAFYRIPRDWDGEAGDGEGGAKETASPDVDVDGSLLDGVATDLYLSDQRLLESLPLRQGLDYSSHPYANTWSTNAEPTFRPLFAIVLDPQTGKFRYCHNLADPDIQDARVAPASRELGLWVVFHPQHVLGLNHLGSAEVYETEPAFDYSTMVATVAIQTDTHLAASATQAAGVEWDRELLITVPDAELWYVLPGTVVGIDDDGDLIHVDGTAAQRTLRSDADRLLRIATLAHAWYSTAHYAVRLQRGQILDILAAGDFLLDLTTGTGQVFSVDSICTRQEWNFQEHTTTVTTGYMDIDWPALAPVNAPTVADMRQLMYVLAETREGSEFARQEVPD